MSATSRYADMHSITERLNRREFLLLDGALGTELERRGIATRLPLWSAEALLEQPELVREIHEQYIRAGAEVITTATFRTSRRTLDKVGMGDRARELTRLAVRLAVEARENAAERPVWIAGSVAPLEECYDPSLVPPPDIAFEEHRELARWLAEAGVDLLLLETMNTVSEARAALEAGRPTGLPVWVSVICGADGRLLGGDTVAEAVAELEPLEPLGPAALLINCTPAPWIEEPLRQMIERATVPVGVYANMGVPQPNGSFRHFLSPREYAGRAAEWVGVGARIVGGCCGTTPEHIRALAALPSFAAREAVHVD